jgi:predicted dehydrogenase
MSTVGIALIGAGPWGRTLARALAGIETAELRWVCERDDTRRGLVASAHPRVPVTSDLDEVLADPAVTAVAVAVDSPGHHTVGMKVLTANRHLLMEKPLALAPRDAGALIATAAARSRVLTVGHLLLHHPAVERARQLVEAGALGAVQYLQTTRVSAGPPRAPGSTWWTLAPHDVSLALHLLGATPATVSATGGAYAAPGEDGVANATLRFTDGRIAQISVARYAPTKERRCVIAGGRRTLTFDELDQAQPLLLRGPGDTAGEAVAVGDAIDPLRAQCAHFVACAARGDVAGGNGSHAHAVVEVLAAGEASMRAGGVPIEVA